MTEISLEVVTGKLNTLGYDTFMKALRQAKNLGNQNLEIAHWVQQILKVDRSDLTLSIDYFKIDRTKLQGDVDNFVGAFAMNRTEMPDISEHIIDGLDRGWHYATLFFGETQIRTGHLLVAILKDLKLRRALLKLSDEFGKIDVEQLAREHASIWQKSDEENLQPMDGSGLRGSGSPGDEAASKSKSSTALDRYSVDLTAKARAGEMDPIVGRDEEIRQIIDVLMRRRQNNPILTGEAGVGKTAVVEGFAQRIVADEVPPPLRGVRLCSLDIGLMQAGASMKGEFEQRLRSVIDEVQSSPIPIIMFIDEAHTLIGAGGAAGTGDAANLLKPALARGTLRTVAATTWSEYREHIEKDPALTRRFQTISIEEPDEAKCCDMIRGLLEPMEKHHGVRISDQAIVAAVQLSARYIPARQLPDKAVSLLDTACARVAISQSSIPANMEDTTVLIRAREKELVAQERERDIGGADETRIEEIKQEVSKAKEKLKILTDEWKKELALVEEITALRDQIASESTGEQTGEQEDDTAGKGAEELPASNQVDSAGDELEGAEARASEVSETQQVVAPDREAIRKDLISKVVALDEINPDNRMVYAHVDEQAVASVVSDWTGVPVGRMVADEVETILNLTDTLNKRVIGQSHGLSMIAKRIETNRAKLDNPNKPIGVFMLAGPSGVGKTESALALAEALYGGEQNMITINMSEFQEAHTVSALKGAPPGYVGYGEGGRLTEAVRRKPYSVVLLDEIEKAHGDVHELFFQVFDKGQMEDGTGRMIDFKNTLIILTTNVGTDLIMERALGEEEKPDPEELAVELRPYLLQEFPAALLGRIVTIPYFPLSGEMLGKIIRLQLNRVVKRIKENHNAIFEYDETVVEHIVSKCNDPDSGGRMIDNIITNSLLPELSREFLKLAIDKKDVTLAKAKVVGGVFEYEVR